MTSLPSTAYSWEKRLDVVSRYLLLGNMRVISEQTGIDYNTLLSWKKSDWWPDMVEQIKRQKKGKTNEHITKIIEQSLEVMQDRLDNGDFILNNKTGEIMRKPVNIKDATTIATSLIQRQLQVEESMERDNKSSDTVQETLTMLAKEFQKWTKKKPSEDIVDIPFTETDHAIHEEREARL